MRPWPTPAPTFFGWLVITGPSLTVRATDLEYVTAVGSPQELLTSTSYEPASLALTIGVAQPTLIGTVCVTVVKSVVLAGVKVADRV